MDYVPINCVGKFCFMAAFLAMHCCWGMIENAGMGEKRRVDAGLCKYEIETDNSIC